MYKVYLDQQLIHDLESDDNVLINPTLDLELNKAGTFEFSMECTHPFYDKLERFGPIVQVLCDGDEIFKGRIIEITDDMYKERKVYCESELAYLNDTIQRPYEYHLAASAVYEYMQNVIGSHNGQVDSARQFTLGEITVNDPNDYIYCYTNYNTTMDEIKEDLVDDLGGYIRIRNEYSNNDPLGTLTGRYIDYIELEEYGRTSEQRIEFGENLLDFSNDINQADICTGIIPLGATLEESKYAAIEERVTIESVNSGSDYIVIPEAVEKYGLILKVVTWDDITEPKNLLSAAKKYLEEYDYEPQTITATAVDMHLTDEEIESWRLGDKIFVESDPHDLHKRFPLAQMSIPLDAPENTSVTLGTYEDTSLSGRTNRTETGLRNFENFQVGNVIASAIAQASAIIKARTNGYVTIHYDEDRDCADEILIMDAPNTDDATRVWRWNLNGLGYSKNGYDGDYGLAITMNGWILGSFIIANGMILADDNEATFGKFTNNGMEIYAQSGREDLLLMSVGKEGMTLYDTDGASTLATFYSDGIKVYGGGSSRVGTLSVTEDFYPGITSTVSYGAFTFNISATSGTVTQIRYYSVTAEGYIKGEDFTASVYIDSSGQYVNVAVTNNTSEYITCDITVTAVWQVTATPFLLMSLDGNGLQIFDRYSTIRSQMDDNSLDIYDNNGVMMATVDSNGFSTFDSNGTMRSNIGRTSLLIYGSDGGQRIRLSSDGLYTYTERGYNSFSLTAIGLNLYTSGTWLGYIGTISYYENVEEKSLSFSLRPEACGATWAWLKSTSDKYYTEMLACLTDNSSQGEYGINAFSPMFMNQWRLHLGTSSSTPYFTSVNNGGDGGFYGGNFYFEKNVYSNGTRLTTLSDTVNVMLTANGEEAEGELSFYSGMKLDVSDLVDYKSSDETIKTDIQPIADARVDNLTPVSFKWRDGDNTAHYGYIAQEVREHIPEIVKENDDGLLSLAYTEIIPLLHAKINTLEERIARLEEIIYG